MKRILTVILCSLLLLSFVKTSTVADEAVTLPQEYDRLEDYIPEDIAEYLPDGLFGGTAEDTQNAVMSMADFDFIFDFVSRLINIELKSSLSLLISVVAAIMLGTVTNSLCADSLSGAGSEISAFLSNLCVLSILLTFGGDMLECAEVFFNRVNLFMIGMIPLMCTLCAMGGALASAVTVNYGISAFLGISEMALSKTITPIVGTCIGLASVGGIGDSTAGKSLLATVKKTYVFLIGMLMTVMMFVFSARGIMAHSADTLGGRAIKFAAGSFIPIVGSSIGEILRGVGSGLSYVRNTVGVVAVVMIFMMILPVFINVVFRRTVLGIAEALSDFLGMNACSRLIHEFSSIYGMLLAVISMSSMLFIGAVIICVKIGSGV